MRESAVWEGIITLGSYDTVGRIRSVPPVREFVHRTCLIRTPLEPQGQAQRMDVVFTYARRTP